MPAPPRPPPPAASASRSTSVTARAPAANGRRAAATAAAARSPPRGRSRGPRRRSADRRAGRSSPRTGGGGLPAGCRPPGPRPAGSRRAPTAPHVIHRVRVAAGMVMLRRIVLARAIAPLLAVAALAGCGSSDDVPPAAVPASSPPLTERPAGRVVPIAGQPRPAGGRPARGGRPRAAPSPSSTRASACWRCATAAGTDDRPRRRRGRPDARRGRPRRADLRRRHHRQRAAGLRAAPAAAPDAPAPGPRQPVRDRLRPGQPAPVDHARPRRTGSSSWPTAPGRTACRPSRPCASPTPSPSIRPSRLRHRPRGWRAADPRRARYRTPETANSAALTTSQRSP